MFLEGLQNGIFVIVPVPASALYSCNFSGGEAGLNGNIACKVTDNIAGTRTLLAGVPPPGKRHLNRSVREDGTAVSFGRDFDKLHGVTRRKPGDRITG